jgi:hypothetical protein
VALQQPCAQDHTTDVYQLIRTFAFWRRRLLHLQFKEQLSGLAATSMLTVTIRTFAALRWLHSDTLAAYMHDCGWRTHLLGAIGVEAITLRALCR